MAIAGNLVSRCLAIGQPCPALLATRQRPLRLSKAVVKCLPGSRHGSLDVDPSSSLRRLLLMSCPLGWLAGLEPAKAGPEAAEEQDAADEDILEEGDFREVMDQLDEFYKVLTQRKLDLRKLEEAREKLGFRRTIDGRVMLQSRDGDWFLVKADMKTEGLLLLRDSRGYIFYIAPNEDLLRQIDLSDDWYVAQLFTSHAWEELLEPVDVRDGDKVEPLNLTEKEFRNLLSVVEGAEYGEEEDLEALPATAGEDED